MKKLNVIILIISVLFLTGCIINNQKSTNQPLVDTNNKDITGEFVIPEVGIKIVLPNLKSLTKIIKDDLCNTSFASYRPSYINKDNGFTFTDISFYSEQGITEHLEKNNLDDYHCEFGYSIPVSLTEYNNLVSTI